MLVTGETHLVIGVMYAIEDFENKLNGTWFTVAELRIHISDNRVET
jgi:hypothetical protein